MTLNDHARREIVAEYTGSNDDGFVVWHFSCLSQIKVAPRGKTEK